MFGAGTLRAYGTTLTVSHPILLQHRIQEGKPPSRVHIVITHSANLNPEIYFFKQPVRRWLLTNTAGARSWQEHEQTLLCTKETSAQEYPTKFEQILVFETPTGKIDIFGCFATPGIYTYNTLSGLGWG